MRSAALALAVVWGVACTGTGAPPTTTEAVASARPSPIAGPSTSSRPVGKGHLETRSFVSAVLRRTMQYYIYLPGGYDDGAPVRYPVAYLLHGGGGSNREWIENGALDTADRLMGSGAIPPFIIVLPQGDQEYWVDHVVDRTTGANGEKWGTYTAREVVPEIDKSFRTVAKLQGRAIGGLSMGGHGAMQLSINFPGTWSAVGAHSPSLRPLGDAPTYLGTTALQFAERDPLQLIRTHPDVARTLRYWIDSAQLDPWIVQATALHEQLLADGIVHEWSSDPGGHDTPYWSSHMDAYLRFYAGALCRDRASCPANP